MQRLIFELNGKYTMIKRNNLGPFFVYLEESNLVNGDHNSWNYSIQRNFIVHSILGDFRKWRFVNLPSKLIPRLCQKTMY